MIYTLATSPRSLVFTSLVLVPNRLGSLLFIGVPLLCKLLIFR
jgi:hypothetical protein